MKYLLTLLFPAMLLVACNNAESESTTMSNELIESSTGLKVEILEQGDGVLPKSGQKVMVHYKGTLDDGTTFDSSYDRGEPIQFALGQGQVIPGWDEGIALLSKGAKARLTIPPSLAYGDREIPGIPANSTLTFEVELIDIKEAPVPVQHQPYSMEDGEKVELPSGLTLYIIEEGTGEQAKPGSTVSVHYYGYLKENGQRFDDSFSRGEPIEFPLGEGMVIPGWEEGIAELKVGTKAVLDIPYHLAYGEGGRPPVIPAKADLIFDVYLVDLK